MNKSVLLTAVAAFALTAGGAYAGAPTVAGTGARPHYIHHFGSTPGSTVLYNQNSNDGGTGVDSQNFESTYAAYDDAGADDFKVPKGHTWKVKEVDVTGVYFSGSGPASSENVIFYKDASGLPGAKVAEVDGRTGTDSGGSFAIKFGKGNTVKLTKGKYWVSVVANCSFTGGCGEWGWEVNSVQHGNMSAWENPGGGFGVCPTWGTTESCIGYGPDFMFELKGSST